MSDNSSTLQIFPGRGLGWISLGASIHAIITCLKSQPLLYPRLELSYSATEPILEPVVLSLPDNGLRLRFDGPEQRLRLIEILDFSKATFVYKSTELVRRSSSSNDMPSEVVTGPSFRHVYNRLFGPTYPGEYIAPEYGYPDGTYVLSYPGLAARFPVRHKSWSPKTDFVSLLSSSAAGPASSIAIFQGQSWPEARSKLYTQRPHLTRSLGLAAKSSENIPDEIDEILIHPSEKLELLRHSSTSFSIILNATTPQDLVAELGPPDAIYRKSGNKISIHADGVPSRYRDKSISPSLDTQISDHDDLSNRSYTDDSENDGQRKATQHQDNNENEAFYNYFHHGFDVLIAAPAAQPPLRNNEERLSTPPDYVVTKVFLHGNVPGSYSFNRHRRSRWRIHFANNEEGQQLNSEMRFAEIRVVLREKWHETYADAEEAKRMQRGMVLNRGWDESPESSIELLGGFEEGPPAKHTGQAADSVPNMSNTELFGFPGLLFEVLKNDLVSCLTVYQS